MIPCCEILTADVEEQDKKAQHAHVERLWEMIAEQRELSRVVQKHAVLSLMTRGPPSSPGAVS